MSVRMKPFVLFIVGSLIATAPDALGDCCFVAAQQGAVVPGAARVPETTVVASGLPPEQVPNSPAAAVAAAKPQALPAIEALLRLDDTLASARASLGEANVVLRQLDGSEGETFVGWVLYPGDPARSIDVFLDDAGEHPLILRVRGSVGAWTRADGVHLGMSSVELQALNGKPFGFSGFGWDLGGIVTNWRGGRLDPENWAGSGVTLCPPPEQDIDDYPSGDREYASDDPSMRGRPLRVCQFGAVVGK